MKDLIIRVDNKSLCVLEGELNILVVTSSYSKVQVIGIKEEQLISYNILVNIGEIVTTNDFPNDFSIGLTQAYISSIENKVLSRNQFLLIDIIGVDYNGFCKIYNFLRDDIVHKIRSCVLFIRLDTLANLFDLVNGSNILLSQEQLKIKEDESKLSFNLKKY